MQRHDVIVIGGGLNGLTAAACLARAGADVLLLERNAGFGVAAGYDIAPGFRMPRYSLGTSTLPARLVADLELTRHGLRLLRVDGGVSLLAGGAYQASYRDGVVHRRELARVSPKDADAWTRYRRDMLAAAARLRPLLSRRMSDPSKRSIANIRRLLGAADAFASIGAAELHELTRLWTLSAVDFLSDYFVSEEVKSHLAAAALSGATFGPFAPGSARLLLQPFMEETGAASAGAPAAVLALGGPEAVAAAFVAAIVAHGGTVRTEAEVTDIILRRDEARGVSLANGEEIYARAILSDLDLKRTFLTLFPWKELPSGLVKRVGRFRLRGVTAKINIALDAAPLFPDVPEGCPALLGVTRLAGSLDEMDRALGDWRDRMPPRAPLIEALVPSLVDRSLAPEGKHVMSVCVHGVPEILHDGPWTGARRDELAELVVKRIAERSPGFRDRILALDTLVPPDIEAEVGLTSGDFAQGEETLDQMFFNRPFASLSGHETPIRNFYLCSASGHPGSLAPGGAGADAARLVAAALGKRGPMPPPEKNFDVIVIGGGHNGLVAAAYLAKAGRRVLLLEASGRLGGALATEDITPDYRISTGAQMIDMLPRRIEKDLKLAGHGLRYAARYVPTIALNPTNGHLVLSRRRRDIEVLRKKSARDADTYLAFSKRMKSYAALIAPFLDKAPLAPGQSAARAALRRLVWRGALLDAASREALLRDLPGSIGHMLDDAFETPILKGALAFDTLVGTAAGPYDAGTVLRGIYRKAQRLAGAGAWAPQGGLGAFVDALAAAAAGLGVTIEVSAPVARILVEGDAVVGVETAAGEIFHAPQVLSSIHPRATLLDLLGANRLDAGLVARLSRIPTRGATAKLNLALSGLPTIQGLAPAEYGARLIVAPSLDDIQEAHAQAKRGTFASNPVMEVTFPSVADPTLAPVGHHVMSIAIQYVPYEAEGGWDDKRDRLIDRVVETLSIYAPDLKQLIVAGELLLPADLERKFGLAGGDWHQGELRPDRLLSFRPTPELAQYGTPVAGLFPCGAGSHPGGGVTGMAGRLAAEAALARRAGA